MPGRRPLYRTTLNFKDLHEHAVKPRARQHRPQQAHAHDAEVYFPYEVAACFKLVTLKTTPHPVLQFVGVTVEISVQ